MHKSLFTVLLILSLCNAAHAVKFIQCYKKVSDIINKENELHKSKGFLESTIDLTTQITTMPPFVLVGSTTSSASSMAPCSWSAKLEQRNNFIEQNYYAVQMDSAKGSGEYLSAVAYLSGCASTAGVERFNRKVQTQFQSIFSNPSPAKAGNHMDTIILADPVLNQMCRSEG